MIPENENIDPRAEKFFSRYYVGQYVNDADQFGYVTRWNTRHEELVPTKCYHRTWCAYCGSRAFAIQPSHLGFDITGHSCSCKEAMDEVEYKQKLEQLKEKHEEEISALKKTKPKPSEDVKRKIIKNVMKDSFYLDRILKSLDC